MNVIKWFADDIKNAFVIKKWRVVLNFHYTDGTSETITLHTKGSEAIVHNKVIDAIDPRPSRQNMVLRAIDGKCDRIINKYKVKSVNFNKYEE